MRENASMVCLEYYTRIVANSSSRACLDNEQGKRYMNPPQQKALPPESRPHDIDCPTAKAVNEPMTATGVDWIEAVALLPQFP